MPRRLTAVFATLALAAAALAQARPDQPLRITHGPMLGRPGATEMAVWARTSRPGAFLVRYGESTDKLASAKAQTALDADNTGWVLLTGLKPNTQYVYRVEPENGPANAAHSGSFRTLPAAKNHANPKYNPKGLFNFRFESGSCANQGKHGLGPSLPLYKTMLAKKLPEQIHFAVLNGDWLYEEQRDFAPKDWRTLAGLGDGKLPRLVELAPTITGVWKNYQLYLERGKNLSAWHRVVPSFFTFDDHEILNDVNGCGHAGLRDRRAVFRDIALKAWHDYLGWANPPQFSQPIHFGRASLTKGSDVLEDRAADFTKLNLQHAANLHVHWGTPDAGVDDVELDKKGGDPNAGVYDIAAVLDKHRLRVHPAAKADGTPSYSIGRRSYYRWRVSNCEFFALDTRSHRTKHDHKKPDRPDVTLLGAEQKAWLKDAMAQSDADFFFVFSSVPFMIPHDGAGGMSKQAPDKDDAWTVFLHEREEMIRYFEKRGKPVFVLTGDLHNSFAVKVSANVWEFCCGPHNSRNHPAGSEGKRPANGQFKSGNRTCDIRWSSYFHDETLHEHRLQPIYCVVQVNNVFKNHLGGREVWVAYPHPQVVFQYYDGLTGELLYAESVRGKEKG